HVSLTPDKIERGRYLANAVCACVDCHSTREWTQFSGPMIDSTAGIGREPV
ncbi:MAG: cytochrome C, partial [Chitinophagaceae bacterium]|nr:cytochrome C [Chitinophagaceae bacterium]